MENIFTKQIKRMSEISDIRDKWEIESLVSDYVNTIENINDRTSSATPYVNNVSKDALIKKIESSGGINSSFANNLKLERDFFKSQYNAYVKFNNEVNKYSNSFKKELSDIENKLTKEGKTSQEILKAKKKFSNSKQRLSDFENFSNDYNNYKNSIQNIESFRNAENKHTFLSNWSKNKPVSDNYFHEYDSTGNVVAPSMRKQSENVKEHINENIINPSISKQEIEIAQDIMENENYLSPTEGINVPGISQKPQENQPEVNDAPEATESSEIVGVYNMPGNANSQQTNQNSGVSPARTNNAPKAEVPQYYRIKTEGGPDKLFDATSGKQILDKATWEANYATKGARQVDIPADKQIIFRDGEKIFDAKTNKQILNEEELKNYANAVEIDKPKEKENIRDYSPKGTRADNQEYLSEDDIKVLEERQAASPDKPSEKVYSEAMKETGDKEIQTSDKPVRKFTRILRDENGNIKTENGKPQYEDYYLPVYTKEEKEALTPDQKNEIINKVKEKFIAQGGTEETWASSQELQAVNDTLEKEASGDELYRAGEYAARYASTEAKLKEEAINKAKSLAGADWDKLTDDEKNTKIEENLKEIKVKNNMGADVNYNVSEEIIFDPRDMSLVESERRIKENKKNEPNPWVANAEAAKTVEAPKFVKTVDDSMEDKKQAYRKITKGRIEGQE